MEPPVAGEPIISTQCRFRCPEHFSVGRYSIVDDYCYFSTRVEVGDFSHIAAGCSVGGGSEHLFRLGDYSSLSMGVRILCSSNDFVNDVIHIAPAELGDLGHGIRGDVILERLTGVGANSVVMPDNHVPEGTAIGALSFVPPRFDFEPWSVYAGCPVRLVNRRNRDSVLRQREAIEAGLRRKG
jgi:acetyltransferase-like isoleucine patch superfamily enzyme